MEFTEGYIFVCCFDDNHDSQVIILESTNSKAIEYEQLEDLVLASDLIIEARVLGHPEVIEVGHFP